MFEVAGEPEEANEAVVEDGLRALEGSAGLRVVGEADERRVRLAGVAALDLDELAEFGEVSAQRVDAVELDGHAAQNERGLRVLQRILRCA